MLYGIAPSRLAYCSTSIRWPTPSSPTLSQFGPACAEIGAHLAAQGLKRPLVVTDRGLAALPLFREIVDGLREARLNAAVFSEVGGNPSKSQVSAGVEAFRSHSADAIVGVGGGAGLDVAKAVALMASHPGDLFDYEDGLAEPRQVDGSLPYWVAVPPPRARAARWAAARSSRTTPRT